MEVESEVNKSFSDLVENENQKMNAKIVSNSAKMMIETFEPLKKYSTSGKSSNVSLDIKGIV